MRKFEKLGFVVVGIDGNETVFEYKGRTITMPTPALKSGYVNAMLRKLPFLEKSAERIRTGDLNSLIDDPRYQGIAVWDLVRMSMYDRTTGKAIRKPNTYMMGFVQQFSGLTLNYLPSHKGV